MFDLGQIFINKLKNIIKTNDAIRKNQISMQISK